MADATEVVMLGALRGFIAAGADLSNAQVSLFYPDRQPDESKSFVLLELTGEDKREWIGGAGPATNTPGLVDKVSRATYVVRIESWARRANDPGGSSEMARALNIAGAVRRRLGQNKGALLAATGLHYADSSRVQTLPHDMNFPDWFKVAFYFTGSKDETWTQVENA